MRRIAERRIEEAMREGKFDNNPLAGQPLDMDKLEIDIQQRRRALLEDMGMLFPVNRP